jgi:hypothetical protein
LRLTNGTISPVYSRFEKTSKKTGYCSYGSTEQYFELDEQFYGNFYTASFAAGFINPL